MAEISVADALRKYGEVFGLLGALIGLSFIERLTVLAACLALLAGFAFALVGAPIVTHYAAPPPAIRDHVTAGVALLFGITGFVLAGAIHASARQLREWLPEFIRKAIERRAG
jgi:tellurite resistance protein TehA-like permease